MAEKRKLPDRERRESAAKRHARGSFSPQPYNVRTKRREKVSSPVPDPPTPEKSPTPVPVEQGLPTKIKDGDPLPVLHDEQPADLSNKEYQTVNESGVLTASLLRSRNKWLQGEVFQKYWTKLSKSKKKEQPNLQNPPKETMTKHGSCSLIIEPHHFDITLYRVYEPQASQTGQAQAYPSPHQPRQPITYGTPNNFHNFQLGPNAHSQPIQPSPHPQQVNPNAIHQPPYHQPPPPPPPQSHIPHPPPNPQSNMPAQQPPPKPSPDPVIQMLATRAASDPELKALMRVVASSKASPSQLRDFQAHIDELNALIAQQNANKSTTPTPNHYNQPPKPPPQSNGYHNQNSIPPSTPGPPPASAAPPRSTPSPYGPYHPQTHPPPPNTLPPPRPKAPLAPYPTLQPNHYPVPKPEPTAVVFEFQNASSSSSAGDRFLFPAYSILDYLHPGSQVVVSFFVVRKGSEILAENPGASYYHAKTEYYQPVTMRLLASNPKVLEPLARVVKNPGEVRKYMDDVMDRGKRADYVHLATRLPRGDGENGDGDKVVGVEGSGGGVKDAEKVKEEGLREAYEAPTTIPPFTGWGWTEFKSV